MQDEIGSLKSEKKEMDKRFTAKDKEVKSLNARLRLQQAETQEDKTELMKTCEKKVEQIILEKDQIISSVKTENTVLADRNLELMAKLKAVQTDILQSVTDMRMKVTALKDSLRTEETEKEASFNQIKELESHTMDTEEKCLESKGDRKEEGDETRNRRRKKTWEEEEEKKERNERRRCERGRRRERRNSIFPLNPPTPP